MGDHGDPDEEESGVEAMEDESDYGEDEDAVNALPQAFQQQMEQHEDEPDPSMLITEEEQDWALELKRAVTASRDSFPSTPLISDMEYAQHAIVARGNTQEALQRIIRQQHFYSEYGIDNTSEQAVHYLRELMKQQPGYILHLDYVSSTQESLIVTDPANYYPKRSMESTPEHSADYNWRVYAVGFYYLHHTVQPSLASIRQGLIAIQECQGFGWDNFRMEGSSRIFAEVFASLPLKYKSILAYNTHSVVNSVANLVKPFMTRSQRESLHLGCTIVEPDGASSNMRLSELFLQPTLEAAQEVLLQRVARLSTTRFCNETTFRL